jgi:hypothetical protein
MIHQLIPFLVSGAVLGVFLPKIRRDVHMLQGMDKAELAPIHHDD